MLLLLDYYRLSTPCKFYSSLKQCRLLNFLTEIFSLSVVTSFTSNFAWSLGLIFSARIQTSIDETRSQTGGNLTQLAGNLVGGTESLKTLYSRSATLPSTTIEAMNDLAGNYIPSTVNSMSRRAGDTYAVPTVQDNAYDSVQTGFFRYTTGLEISPYNAFTTVLIFSLVFMAVYLLISVAISLPFITRRKETVVFHINEKAQSVEESRFKIRDRVLGIDRQSIGRIIKGNALRMVSLNFDFFRPSTNFVFSYSFLYFGFLSLSFHSFNGHLVLQILGYRLYYQHLHSP